MTKDRTRWCQLRPGADDWTVSFRPGVQWVWRMGHEGCSYLHKKVILGYTMKDYETEQIQRLCSQD